MENGQKEILRLCFQEGKGHWAYDDCGHLPPAEIQYRFRNAKYIPSRDPSWRSCGIHGFALMFDGNSTRIAYPPEALLLGGSALTLSAWIAPRSFPCGDPEAAEGDLKGITAVLGQVDPQAPRGILLGYEAFGRPCFQIGTGTARHTLRPESARLVSGQWNHLAGVWDEARAVMDLYVNGNPAGALTLPRGTRLAPAAGHALLIGQNEGGKVISAGMMDMFCGLMGEIRIESAALSPADIAARASLPGPIGDRGRLSAFFSTLGASLTLDLYVDHSLTEGFFNGEKALSLRSYAPVGPRGIRFEGGSAVRIRRLRLWRMRPIWD
ncbi:MAG: GH32 C-terminal domain-containing protein [Clostridia bacterium]|nr:GH32 C-terminal domain-containing protein [Clostridia bacterium]